MKTIEMRLDLDLRCNFRCSYCPQSEGGQPTDIFSLEEFEKVLREINSSVWSVYLSCGGEPLMHPHFKEAIALVNRYCGELDVSIVTNGSLLTEEAAEIIASSVISRVYISIDTVDRERYKEVCNSSDAVYERTLQRVESFSRLCYNQRLKGERRTPHVIVTAIAMKQTLDTLLPLAQWVVDCKASGLKVQWLTAVYMPELEKSVLPLSSDTMSVIAQVASFLKMKKVFFEYPYTSSISKLLSVIRGAKFVKNKSAYFFFYVQKLWGSRSKNRCRIMGHSLIVKHDGSCEACPLNAYEMPNILADGVSLSAEVKKAKWRYAHQRNEVCASCEYGVR